MAFSYLTRVTKKRHCVYMNKQKVTQNKKERRIQRVRAKIVGTAARPRLAVSRSNRYLYLQLIDDTSGRTLVSAHSREIKAKGKPIVMGEALGKLLADKAKDKGIKKAVFDRRGNLYHGRVKAVAEGARANGLEF